MSEDTITVVEVQETQYGEVAVLDSPFEAKDFIKVLPWKEYADEVDECGSLADKAINRGMSADNVAISAVEDFVESVGFDDDFATHVSWDPNAMGKSNGAWTIDADSVEGATEFFEFCGFNVELASGVDL